MSPMTRPLLTVFFYAMQIGGKDAMGDHPTQAQVGGRGNRLIEASCSHMFTNRGPFVPR